MLKYIILLASFYAGQAFAEPSSCGAAATVKREVQAEIYSANPPVGQEVYTTHAGYQRLKAAINSCQADAYQSCYPNLQSSIALSELRVLFGEWRKNRLYKLVDPSGLCYQRAYLLAQEISERGYAVQLLQIDPAPALVALTRDDEGRVTHQMIYGKHWVVQIPATDANGVTKTMILDPQFAMEPMARDAYFISVAGETCRPGPSTNVADCSYYVFAPTYQIYPSYADGEILKEKCGWSLGTDAQSAIATAIVSSPASFSPSPYPYEYVRASFLKQAWTTWEAFASADIRSFEAQLLQASDKNAIQRRLDKRKIDLQNIIDRRAAIGF